MTRKSAVCKALTRDAPLPAKFLHIMHLTICSFEIIPGVGNYRYNAQTLLNLNDYDKA